jgi:hypothetical protein
METRDRLTIISLIIASLSLIFTISINIANYSINQKIRFARTDDIFVANQFASFPIVQMQYSITANGPSVKTTTISKIRMTIKRDTDGKSYDLFPVVNSFTSNNLPINLTGNSSVTQLLVFKVKQDGKNTDIFNDWVEDNQKKLSPEEVNIFKKAVNEFSDSFTLLKPNTSQSIFRAIQNDANENKLTSVEYEKLFSFIDIKKMLFFYENTYTVKIDFYNSLGKIIYSDLFKFVINDTLQQRLKNKLDYLVLVEPLKI